MNKRIEELAIEAGLEMCSCGCNMPTRQSAVFAKLIVTEAFRAGMLYSAKKYAAVGDDRFTGNDVALFLEMETVELSDHEIIEHFGVE